MNLEWPASIHQARVSVPDPHASFGKALEQNPIELETKRTGGWKLIHAYAFNEELEQALSGMGFAADKLPLAGYTIILWNRPYQFNHGFLYSTPGMENGRTGRLNVRVFDEDFQLIPFPAESAADPQAPVPKRSIGRSFTGIHEAPSEHAMVPHVNITAIEILTFFPNHTMRPMVAMRLARNGWKGPAMANYINWARNRPGCGEDAILGNTLCKRQRSAGTSITNEKTWGKRANLALRQKFNIEGRTNNMSTADWDLHYRRSDASENPFLVDLACGVVHARFPTGQDAGWVTKAVELALKNTHPDRQYRLSDLPLVIIDIVRAYNVDRQQDSNMMAKAATAGAHHYAYPQRAAQHPPPPSTQVNADYDAYLRWNRILPLRTTTGSVVVIGNDKDDIEDELLLEEEEEEAKDSDTEMEM